MPLKMKQNQFYCVSCRKRVSVYVDDICFKFIKNKNMYNGKMPVLKSECPKCDTNLTKFVKHDDAKKLQKKYKC